MPKHYKYLQNPEDTPSNPLTWERLMEWLSDTGWVEGRVRKCISPLDMRYLDDYIQEVWIQILEVPPDKLMGIWRKGKGKFTNYIKSIISNNICSTVSPLYKNIRKDSANEVTLDDVGWDAFSNGSDTSETITKYPVSNKNGNLEDRVKFEYEKVTIHSENKLYE